MKWNIDGFVEVHFDVLGIDAETEAEAIQIFKETVIDNHNLNVKGYGEYQPTELNFDNVDAYEDFDD
jgi:hypothetical protein